MSKFFVAVMILVGSLVSNVHAIVPKSISASGHQEPNRPQNSVDGEPNTRWSCQGTCWIQYDFGQVAYTSEIRIYWHRGHLRTQTFKLEVSTDGTNWETIFDGSTTIPEEIDMLPWYDGHYTDTDVRYTRITGYGNSDNNWNSLSDIIFINPDNQNGGQFYPFVTEVTASNFIDGNVPENASDFDLGTFWTGNGIGTYLQLELDDVYPLFNIRIAWMNGHTRIQRYAIELSVDGNEWIQVIEDDSTGKTKDPESNILPEPFPAKYVRIIGLGNNSKIAASRVKISVTEVEIIATEVVDGDLSGIGSR